MKFLTRKFSTGVAATFFCAASLGAATFDAAAARSDDSPRNPASGAPAASSSEVHEVFSYPLNGVQLTYEGVIYTLDGSLSGIAGVRADGAGGVHVRAQIKGNDLQVTLPDGTTYQGSGTANLVANARAPRDGVSVFGALTKIQLKSDGENAGDLKLQLRLRGTIDAQNHVVLRVIDARVTQDTDGAQQPGGETRSTFSYPLNDLQLSYQGITYSFAGTFSGISAAQRDGSGGVHIRARIKSDDLTVTLPDGTSYRGTGFADVVANARAPRGDVSVFNAITKIQLVPLDENNTGDFTLQVRVRGTIDANHHVVLTIIDARVFGAPAHA